MDEKSKWSTADFENLSWHDTHFYGMQLTEGEDGTGELEFDIDFITEWLCHKDRQWQFRVAPATLTFNQVFGLRVELDYVAVSAGMTPFSISGLEREEVTYPTGCISNRWRLPVNWPYGLVSFEAPGFSLALRRPAIVVDRQVLLPEESGRVIGA